jgi:hypothetical protein
MKLTKRGKRVRALAILAGILAIWWISGHIWWTPTGYCVGDMVECFK